MCPPAPNLPGQASTHTGAISEGPGAGPGGVSSFFLPHLMVLVLRVLGTAGFLNNASISPFTREPKGPTEGALSGPFARPRRPAPPGTLPHPLELLWFY